MGIRVTKDYIKKWSILNKLDIFNMIEDFEIMLEYNNTKYWVIIRVRILNHNKQLIKEEYLFKKSITKN